MESSALTTRLAMLRRLPRRQRMTSLSDTLPFCGDQERELIASELLELAVVPEGDGLVARTRAFFSLDAADEALAEIARRWQHLPDPIRSTAWAIGRGRWSPIVDALAGSTRPTDRTAAAHLIAQTPQPGLVLALPALIADKDHAVADAAETALMRLSLAAIAPTDPAHLGDWLAALARLPIDQTHLGTSIPAIERAAGDAAYTCMEHGRTNPLLGALLLIHERPNPNPHQARLRRLLTNTDTDAHRQVGAVIRRSDVPLLRARALRWLVLTPVASPAADRLASAAAPAEHELVLSDAHLAEHPTRRSRLGLVALQTRTRKGRTALTPNAPIPDDQSLAALSPAARRNLPRLVAALDAEGSTRRLALSPLLGDPDPLTRQLALLGADALDVPDFAFDSEPTVARSAALRWSSAGSCAVSHQPLTGAGEQRHNLAGVLARSPHAPLRRVAHEDALRGDPWSNTHPLSRLVARRWLQADPDAFIAKLHERLRSTDGRVRTNTVMLVRRLGLVERFELDLVRLASDRLAGEPGARVTATAVAALGDSGTDSARRVVTEALDSTDDRVRANAVESRSTHARCPGDLAQRDADAFTRLVELKDDHAHRVRANALRALLESKPQPAGSQTRLYEPAAVESFAEMLSDDRSMHRLAGAWLAERTLLGSGRTRLGPAWAELSHRLAALAEDDPTPQVRIRATRCARRLLNELRPQPQEVHADAD